MAKRARRRGRPEDPDAAYKRIAVELRSRLESGEWARDEVLPSMRSLADRYEVSRITIRNALDLLRNEGRVALGNGRRIVVTDPKGLPCVTDKLILQVICSWSGVLFSPWHSRLQAGIVRGVAEISTSHLVVGNPAFRNAFPSNLEALPIHGIILMGHFLKKVYRAYERWPTPVVLVDRPPQPYKHHAAYVDGVSTAQDATERLIALGHRRIAYLRRVLTHVRDVDPDSKARQQGYERALKRAGIKRERVWITNSTDYDKEGASPFRSIFGIDPPVTAVVAADDGLASKVITEARRRGLSVPRDLSVVGFGNKGQKPVISGSVFDFEKVGMEAARLLGYPKSPQRCVRLPGEWVDAGTIARPRK